MSSLLVNEYLSGLSGPDRFELERIRNIVKELAPEATEVISYGMPGFRYKGQYLLGYAAFRDHLSLFPTSIPIEELKDKLKKFKIAKGTIQFSVERPLPRTLITEIVQSRMKSISMKVV